MNKIFDCITFFSENFITNLRFEILKNSVDYFVVCESIYDHKGKKKELNFRLNNIKFKNKIIYIVHDTPFSNNNDVWQNQAEQRESIFKGIDKANNEDLIMFSDPDEIPNPKSLENINLKKKFGIFLQKMYCYKFNLFNSHESPWEGTRICKKKNLKSIDYMRQKVKKKNLLQPFWKFYKEKDIEVIEDGGWHFNSLLSPEEISVKLKTFAHTEFADSQYSDIHIIKKNIKEQRDLFKRNVTYKKTKLDESFPSYILQNQKNLKDWILI